MGIELGNVAQFMRLALGYFSHLLFIVLLTVSYCFQNTSYMKFGTGVYDWSMASEIIFSL